MADQWESLYFPLGDHFLNSKEVGYIEQALRLFPVEHILVGDAGEINNCDVGRLVEDFPGKKPRLVNDKLSKPIIDLFLTQKAKSFFGQFFNAEEDLIGVRRSQFNLLGNGAFVGRHLDIDSNPDYQIAAVLQLGSKFSGGDFVVYPNKMSGLEEAQRITPEYGSLTISSCKVEHEVTKITSGIRTSFVCFLSDYMGENRRIPNI